MKRWMICGAAAMLAACSKGGTVGASAGANASVGSQTCDAAAQTLEAKGLNDPFEVYGKVLVTGDNKVEGKKYDKLTPEDVSFFSDPAHAPFIQAKAAGGVKISAGTELTVLLREKCTAGGELTKALRSSKGANGATPSGVRAYTWNVPTDTDSSRLEELANADDCIQGIADSHKAYPTALPTDPRAGEQGHLKQLELGDALPMLLTKNPEKPIVIAIIDTGIDLNHEDLKENIWVNPREIPNNGIDDDHNGYVDDVNGYNFASNRPSPNYQGTWSGYHHGTHVSGLAAARANNGIGGSGVMGSGVKIMMLNVFGSSSGAYSSDIMNAIRYAADNGADVINLSLGGSGRNAAYESALTYAVQKGVTIFAAAGNEHSELGPNYFMSPGAYGQQIPGMLSVGSIDSTNLGISTFSNFSPTYVEIGAPGSEDSAARVGVLSTFPGNKYIRAQGTSMASPVAAGAGALAIAALRERGYKPTPAQIEEIIENSGKVVEPLLTKIRGGRVLNLKAMADYINAKFPPGGSVGTSGPGGPVNGESGNNCSTGANL